MLSAVLLGLALSALPMVQPATLSGVTVSGDANGLVIFQGGVCNACVASLNITYTNASPGTVSITTVNGSRNLLSESIATGMMVVLLRDLDFSGYGMHDMVITVSQGSDSFTGNYVAIVDEPILGMQVSVPNKIVVHVSENFDFNVTMTNGTNVFVGVDFGDLVEVTRDCDGQSVVGLVFNFQHNYTTVGNYRVEVVASNYVNKMTYVIEVAVVNRMVVSASSSTSLVEAFEPVVVQRGA